MAEVPPILPGGDASAEEALRAACRQAADAVADYLLDLGRQPVFPAAPGAPPEDTLLPETGQPLPQVLEDVWAWARENAVHVGHPGYLGHMDSGVAVAGILADLLASALNQNLLAHELAPGATLLERALVRRFAAQAGLPEGAGGLFTTGGTGANLAALLCAREAACREPHRDGLAGEGPLAILASADAHYSIAKAAAVLGLGSTGVVPVPVSGPERRLDTGALPAALEEAVRQGRRPVALVATAGTTSCGALDPLDACADFCEERGLWFHVDAALGGALLLHPVERARLAGIQRADSVTLDPHKWLYAPKSAGILLLRREEDLVPARYDAPYLDRLHSHQEARRLSQGRLSLDGSRRFDALKVWMILRHLGRQGLAGLVEDRLRLTRWFHQLLSEHDFFLPCHSPDLNVQAFAPRDPAARARVADAHRFQEARGRTWTSTTRLEGRPCHRVVLLNPASRESHLQAALADLVAGHRRLAAGDGPGRGEGGGALLDSPPSQASQRCLPPDPWSGARSRWSTPDRDTP